MGENSLFSDTQASNNALSESPNSHAVAALPPTTGSLARFAAQIFGVSFDPASQINQHSSVLSTNGTDKKIDLIEVTRQSEWASRLTAINDDMLIKKLRNCFRKSLYWRNEKSQSMSYKSFEKGMYDILKDHQIDIEQLWEEATTNGHYYYSTHKWTDTSEVKEIMSAVDDALSLQNPSGASRRIAELKELHGTWKILLLPSSETLARLNAAHLCAFASALDLRLITLSLITYTNSRSVTNMDSDSIPPWYWLPLQEIKALESKDTYKKATCDFFITVCRVIGKSLMVLPFDAVQVLTYIMSSALDNYNILGPRRGTLFRTRSAHQNHGTKDEAVTKKRCRDRIEEEFCASSSGLNSHDLPSIKASSNDTQAIPNASSGGIGIGSNGGGIGYADNVEASSDPPGPIQEFPNPIFLGEQGSTNICSALPMQPPPSPMQLPPYPVQPPHPQPRESSQGITQTEQLHRLRAQYESVFGSTELTTMIFSHGGRTYHFCGFTGEIEPCEGRLDMPSFRSSSHEPPAQRNGYGSTQKPAATIDKFLSEAAKSGEIDGIPKSSVNELMTPSPNCYDGYHDAHEI